MNRFPALARCTLLALALAMVPVSKSLASVACGDFVGGTVVLTANLDCSGAGGYTAIGIGADDTVIELNGHTLSGGRDLMGVDVSSYNNVTIRGPGVIRGFWLGVRAGNGRGLTVEGVRFDDLGMGISDNHGQDAVILENEFFNMDFHGIRFATVAAGQPDSTGGLVRGNSFDGGGTAIELCGMQTYGHNISRNRIQNQSHFGIVLSDETHRNRIVGNDVDNSYGGLALFNAQRNRISGDRYTSGTLGVWMYSQPPGSCLNTGLRRVNGNSLDGMSLFEGEPTPNDALRHAIGGLLAIHDECLMICAPHANSYRRFQNYSYAPTRKNWGLNNRSVAIRIPTARGAGTRFGGHRDAG